ncbi:WhiB family transcriptional regulator [Luteipulveratus sp. YIM 133132]|uniref:WhiB family transcriptional regulator n=1 Tax=Luteipulveratus flavus TaxID=3031728 RepID=UPI0023B0CCAF|nr:WhiB family transcriptional regulator [Luteipulveratus sp. YIM 133132]MDE9367318.1 WhiB family transcriptional regulator [Luteipulveratus sp. YIM 133132]
MAARTDSEWMTWACCATRPDLPWTTDAEHVSPWDALTMRQVCASCPVRLACLAHVQEVPECGGWWAGADRDPNAVTLAAPAWETARNGAAQGILPMLVTGEAA